CAANPVDTAGGFRVVCVGLAGLLGLAALLGPRTDSMAQETITTRPIRLFAAYVVVVFAGAPLSVDLPLTAYRGIELTAGLVVLLGAWSVSADEATRRIGDLVYWFVVAMVGSVRFWLLVTASRALLHF